MTNELLIKCEVCNEDVVFLDIQFIGNVWGKYKLGCIPCANTAEKKRKR